jgi:alanine dehydrogenase
MIIGIPMEVKDNEYRIAMTPGGVRHLVEAGHEVIVQSKAGIGSGFSDKEYKNAGAVLATHAEQAWNADLVVKVKEPQPSEFGMLREDLLLFTYLHLAAEKELTIQLMNRRVTAIAYETVEREDGTLPLLTPMSEVAGRMAVQIGARYLEKTNGGRGKILGGVPGVRPADVVILGAGVVGTHAAKMALGMGAHVLLLDINTDRLRHLHEVLHGRLTTLSANPLNIEESVKRADLLIGAVLVKGARAPRLVTRKMIKSMERGSVIVDVAVDQGGCVETVRPTTHSKPIHIVNGILHYGVTNMPGAVPRTSTYALSNATLPYITRLAADGLLTCIRMDPTLAKGINVYQGNITYDAVAEALSLKFIPLEGIL